MGKVSWYALPGRPGTALTAIVTNIPPLSPPPKPGANDLAQASWTLTGQCYELWRTGPRPQEMG